MPALGYISGSCYGSFPDNEFPTSPFDAAVMRYLHNHGTNPHYILSMYLSTLRGNDVLPALGTPATGDIRLVRGDLVRGILFVSDEYR